MNHNMEDFVIAETAVLSSLLRLVRHLLLQIIITSVSVVFRDNNANLFEFARLLIVQLFACFFFI